MLGHRFHLLLPCQALGQALVLSRQGRGGKWLVLSCIALPPPLWVADQVRNDVTMLCIVFTLTFDSSPIKGEGIGWLCCLVSPVSRPTL